MAEAGWPPVHPGCVVFAKVAATALELDSRTPTATLLWAACRRWVDVGAIRAAVSNGADVPRAVEMSLDQGIAPLLWRALESADALSALGDSYSLLRSVADFHGMEAIVMFPRATSAALGPLIEGGLEPVVLKGPALASRYPAPGLRPMQDIDVLLPRRDHVRALEVLRDAGWKIDRPAQRDRYDTVLVRDDIPSLALELHFALEANYEKVTALDPVALWERRVPIDCLGTRAFGLPLPEELVMLATHAGKPFHGFTRLVWIADLAMIVGFATERGRDVDWERVRSVAEAGRCLTLVGAALGLAEHAGVASPRDLFPLPGRGWRAEALRRLLDLSWPLAASGSNTFHLRYALTDGRWRRTRLALGSGHGMSASRRLRWSVGVPADALSRWRNLRQAS